MKMVSSCWRPFVDNCEGGGGGSENHHHHHRGGGGSGGSGGKYEGLLWRKNLGRHSSGEYSMAVVQANTVVEDQSQVESWTLSTGGQQDATFVGVYDGHGGPQASQFVKRNLFYNIKRFSTELQGISDDVLRKAFQATDENFLSAVRKQWQENPSIATTGSCCLAGIISDGVLHTANAGDSRVILGRVDEDTGKITTVQVSKDHNAAMESEREELRRRHPFDHDIVVLRHNVWRVKGMIQVTRSIGDAYLKKSEFNRPPLQAKYRLPKGFTKPILTGEPSVSVRKLSPEDRFLVFASDGLWEHFNNQEVVDIVQTNPRNGIAKRLVQAALKEAAKKREMRYSDLNKIEAGVRRHFHDDITVIVLFLDQIPSYGSSS